MPSCRRRTNAISQINVVPYIDVMLVLLVIFMITAPLFTPGKIDLPSVGNTTLNPQEVSALELTVDQFGKIAIIDHELNDTQDVASINELKEQLNALILLSGQEIANKPFILSIHKDQTHAQAMDYWQIVYNSGFTQIGFAVKVE